MTQVFTEEGEVKCVTVIQAGPCTVTGVKTLDKDGYNAVQLGFWEVSPNKLKNPIQGIFQKNKIACFKYLREFRCSEVPQNKIGDIIDVSMFNQKSTVNVQGKSKGCGFTGVMKRWNFKGAPQTHGASKVHRKPMSAGATDAARVFKGKRSPGRMGNTTVTVRNLKVVRVDTENSLLAVEGAVPGKNNSLLVVKIYSR